LIKINQAATKTAQTNPNSVEPNQASNLQSSTLSAQAPGFERSTQEKLLERSSPWL